MDRIKNGKERRCKISETGTDTAVCRKFGKGKRRFWIYRKKNCKSNDDSILGHRTLFSGSRFYGRSKRNYVSCKTFLWAGKHGNGSGSTGRRGRRSTENPDFAAGKTVQWPADRWVFSAGDRRSGKRDSRGKYIDAGSKKFPGISFFCFRWQSESRLVYRWSGSYWWKRKPGRGAGRGWYAGTDYSKFFLSGQRDGLPFFCMCFSAGAFGGRETAKTDSGTFTEWRTEKGAGRTAEASGWNRGQKAGMEKRKRIACADDCGSGGYHSIVYLDAGRRKITGSSQEKANGSYHGICFLSL